MGRKKKVLRIAGNYEDVIHVDLHCHWMSQQSLMTLRIFGIWTH